METAAVEAAAGEMAAAAVNAKGLRGRRIGQRAQRDARRDHAPALGMCG